MFSSPADSNFLAQECSLPRRSPTPPDDQRLAQIAEEVVKLRDGITSLDSRLNRVEERVDNHIKFLWVILAFIVVSGTTLIKVGTDISSRLTRVETRIEDFGKAGVLARLNPFLRVPESAASAAITDSVIEGMKLAGDKRIEIPRGTVRKVFDKGIALSDSNLENSALGWSVVLQAADYISTQNSPPIRIIRGQEGDRRDHPFHANRWIIDKAEGELPTDVFPIGKHVGLSIAARMTKIGVPPDYKGAPIGAEYVVALGGSAVLDQMHLNRVIFQNVHVIYRGGPLKIANTYFIDCTFSMKLDMPSQQFAKAIIDMASVTFQYS